MVKRVERIDLENALLGAIERAQMYLAKYACVWVTDEGVIEYVVGNSLEDFSGHTHGYYSYCWQLSDPCALIIGMSCEEVRQHLMLSEGQEVNTAHLQEIMGSKRAAFRDYFNATNERNKKGRPWYEFLKNVGAIPTTARMAFRIKDAELS